MGYKNNYDEIKKQVELLKRTYKFKGLLHFTDFSNLKNILEGGFLNSRDFCENNHINFQDGANHSVLERASDYVHKCVRFYYRGKTPTLYNNEGIKLTDYCNDMHIPIPVFLLFDEELLYLDNTCFSNGNATNSDIGNTSIFFENMDWNVIFHSSWFEPDERDYIVNKRQAELLSNDPVSLKYLKKIIFRCETDKKRAISLFGYDRRYQVKMNLFSDKSKKEIYIEKDKNNFIKDYDIVINYSDNGKINSINLKLKYQKPWNEYGSSLSVFDINGINNDGLQVQVNNISDLEKDIYIMGVDTTNWYKIEVYLNKFLCIEEYLLKYEIIDSNISIINNALVFYCKFANFNFFNYNHRIEIFDSENNIMYNNFFSYNKNSHSLAWNTTFDNYREQWVKLNYYINDVLCISNEIIPIS